VPPRAQRPTIDGFAAEGALQTDCFPRVLSAPPELRPAPFDIIFETPGGSDVALQASAMKEAMLSILAEYRQFIAYGDGL
ncbi:MAG: peptidase M14, partial [Verrucomicrobiota bacterium]